MIFIFYPLKKTNGFTFVELLIVATIALFLLTLSVPFVTSVRADVSLARTTKQIKTDLLATLAYGASGKSFAALSENDLLNPGFIPSHYAMQFTVAPSSLEPTSYYYMELRTDSNLSESKQLYKVEKELDVPGTFLKSIRLKATPEEEGKFIESVWVVFVPPFGKVLFAPGETLEDLESIEQESIYSQMELVFGYKDRPQETVLRFDTSKTLSVI